MQSSTCQLAWIGSSWKWMWSDFMLFAVYPSMNVALIYNFIIDSCCFWCVSIVLWNSWAIWTSTFLNMPLFLLLCVCVNIFTSGPIFILCWWTHFPVLWFNIVYIILQRMTLCILGTFWCYSVEKRSVIAE